jgi:hypothetical protein
MIVGEKAGAHAPYDDLKCVSVVDKTHQFRRRLEGNAVEAILVILAILVVSMIVVALE